jgi:hypothetical protein
MISFSDALKKNKLMKPAHYCLNPRPELCTDNYDPVCAWFDCKKIECINYPCAIEAANSCYACLDYDIEYWTSGPCPVSK